MKNIIPKHLEFKNAVKENNKMDAINEELNLNESDEN